MTLRGACIRCPPSRAMARAPSWAIAAAAFEDQGQARRLAIVREGPGTK